jgi:apolipoprotein N-acyltransferase
MAPIICYESIYGEFVTDYVKKGANFRYYDQRFLVGSYGRTQTAFILRKLRAIETRREIARAANSGISAHINAKGEIMADTFYGDQTALFAKVNLYDTMTFYTRAGDLLSRFSLFALGFLLFYYLIEWFKKKTKKA